MAFTTSRLSAQSAPSGDHPETVAGTRTPPDKDPGYVKGITTARALSLVEILLGLMSVVIGWRAKVLSLQVGARLAWWLGLLTIVLSAGQIAATAGAVFGSGSGKAGSILALALGLTGCLFSRPALRARPNR